jgi:hypothetical protein
MDQIHGAFWFLFYLFIIAFSSALTRRAAFRSL